MKRHSSILDHNSETVTENSGSYFASVSLGFTGSIALFSSLLTKKNQMITVSSRNIVIYTLYCVHIYTILFKTYCKEDSI